MEEEKLSLASLTVWSSLKPTGGRRKTPASSLMATHLAWHTAPELPLSKMNKINVKQMPGNVLHEKQNKIHIDTQCTVILI